MPLKDQDKIAWGWAESTDPRKVTNDHILSAYRIKHNFCKNKTCRRNCRGNPFCLSGLGEARLIESLNNQQSDDTNSALPRRADGSFVGLKNLGATCYVNSLLQLLFHNKAFRDAIFSWNPLEDPVEQNNISLLSDGPFHPETVIGHLQQLFALMYHSKCRYIDPTPLVESLRLDTSTQQDAQEFSKLFVSLLERDLSHQSLQPVQNIISDNFRGEYMYVTRCCRCQTESVSPSMFYELELNVKGHSTLTECLAEFLQQERLEGANSYSCAVCQSKEEACRFIKLCSLPPVLNLQLLRFVYDREKGQKKKLKTVVQFPETLDMKDFVGEASNESLLYNLSAVLIHKGTRATSGHFVAYIKDVSTGAWNTFNDESVERLEGKKLKLDEEDPENSKKPKTVRLSKGFQSSTDAYMLVYTSVKHEPCSNEVKISDRLQNYVDSKNNIFDEICEEVVVSKRQDLVRQEQLLNMYRSMAVHDCDDLNDMDVISTEWLTSLLNTKSEIARQVDNTKLVCTHGRLDPCAVNSAKYISGYVADWLYEEFSGGPRLKMSEAMCESCVTNTCLILRTKAQTLDESKEITNLLRKRMSLDEPGFYVDKYSLKTWRTKLLNIVEGKSSSSSKSFTVGLTTNGEASEPMSEESVSESQIKPSTCSNSDNVFPEIHETDINLSTRRSRLRKLKHRNALLRRKQNPKLTVPLSTLRDCYVMCHRLESSIVKSNDHIQSRGSSVLDQCKNLKVKLRRLTLTSKGNKLHNDGRTHLGEKKKEARDVRSHSGQCLAVKTEFENGEISQPSDNSDNLAVAMKTEDEEGNKSDDGVDSNKAFNEGIMCPHGNLAIGETDRKLVPVRVWEILKQYFPSAPSFPHDTEPCFQCQNLASKDEVVKQHYQESAINQKKVLSDLFNLKNRPQPGRTDDTVYVLHKEYFYQPWSAFLRAGTKKEGSGSLVEPPSTLNVDILLCLHGGLHYSPQYEDDQQRLVLVTRQEWEILTSLYTTNLEVTLAPDLSTSPELCEACFSTRIENEEKEKFIYGKARLHIRQVPSLSSVEDQILPEYPTKKPRTEDGSTSPIPPEYKKVKKGLTTNGPGLGEVEVRRSARRRKIPGQKDVHLIVSSSLTLRELKQMITGQLAVAPFDQHLSTVNGKELEGDSNTLSSFGILPNSTLLLQIDEPKDSFDDSVEECCTPTEPEAGFKGTGLLHAY